MAGSGDDDAGPVEGRTGTRGPPLGRDAMRRSPGPVWFPTARIRRRSETPRDAPRWSVPPEHPELATVLECPPVDPEREGKQYQRKGDESQQRLPRRHPGVAGGGGGEGSAHGGHDVCMRNEPGHPSDLRGEGLDGEEDSPE